MARSRGAAGTALTCAALFGSAAVLSGGCARDGMPAHVVRDSAGVVIVKSLRPSWGEETAWTVAADPVLSVGVVEGDPAYQFGMISGCGRLAGGGVVVADGMAQEVRFFGGDGTFRRTLGRAGAGPGEFTGLAGLGVTPDGRVWAYDFSLRRITWMTADGDLGHMVTLGPAPPVLNAVGPLPDGTFLLKQLWGAEAVAGASSTGLRRDPVAYVRFDTTGALVDTLGLFPGREVALTEEGGRAVMGTPLLARNSVGAVWGERVVVGSMVGFELEAFRTTGEKVRIMRIPGRDLPVTDGEADAMIQARLDAADPRERPGLRATLEAAPRPETRPGHGDVLADPDGNLWVAEWAPPGIIPGSWTVLDAEGRWLGDVVMPNGFMPAQVGATWILGVQTDALDVERVVVYPLIKR